MVGKNNLKHHVGLKGTKVQRFTIKKLSVGVASVTIGAMLLIPNSALDVNAAELDDTTIESEQSIAEEAEETDELDLQEVTPAQVSLEAPETYEVATRDSYIEGITPENAEEIRVFLPGDTEEYHVANILSQNPFTGERAFSLALPVGYRLPAGEEVQVVAVDGEGTQSAPTDKTVVDSDALTQLTVDSIYPETEVISGTVNLAVESVQVVLPNGAQIGATVGEDGVWTANLFANSSSLTIGESIDVRVRIDGNTHTYVDEFVVEEAPEETVELPRPQGLTLQRLPHGATIYAENFVRNIDEFPEGTTFEFYDYDTQTGTESILLDVRPNPEFRNERVVIRASHPDAEDSVDSFNFTVIIEAPEEAPIDLEESSLIVARLGYYGNRYYQTQITLVDELGRPVENLTEDDFELLGFGGITNFQADGNYYRLDTERAAELRPEHSWSIEDGVITINIEEEMNFITFDPNGGEMNNELQSVEVPEGVDYQVPYNFTLDLKRPGYTFIGWKMNGEGELLSPYQPIINVSEDTTLVAQWAETVGKFSIHLYDENPATQNERYAVTLRAEDGTEYVLTSNSYSANYRTWEVEDIPNGTYTLLINGFEVSAGEKFGQNDTTSSIVINEEGTATVELGFVDDKSTTFIRYKVYGESIPEIPVVTIDPVYEGANTITGTGNPGESIEISVSGSFEDSEILEISEDGLFSYAPGIRNAMFRLFANGYSAQAGDVITVRWASGDGRVLDQYVVQATPDNIDLTPLLELITEAEAYSNEDGQYTEESFTALTAAISDAQSALDSIETEEDLVEILNALQAAIDGLEEVPGEEVQNPEEPDDSEEPENPTEPENAEESVDFEEEEDSGEPENEENKNEKELPKTGVTSSSTILTGMVSLLSGLGLMIAPKTKRKD